MASRDFNRDYVRHNFDHTRRGSLQRHQELVSELGDASRAIAEGRCPQCGGQLNECDCGFRLVVAESRPWDETAPFYRKICGGTYAGQR